jgi:ABC-2 type transport system ATP-binding protein
MDGVTNRLGGRHQGNGMAPIPVTGDVLCFEQVSHWYGSHRVLSSVSLNVGRGETVALLGPNGAGKSTMISVMLGLFPCRRGHVRVLGTSPQQAVKDGRVGAMLQTGSGSGLPPGVRVGALLNLVIGLHPRPADRAVIVERSGIGPLMDRRTDRLSGGQAQRVRFAMAIAGDPELVFLDEPTSAMDVTAQSQFWAMIESFSKEGRTTFFATHHLREADRVADRVIVLSRGVVVADGAGATLKAAAGARRISFHVNPEDEPILDGLEGVTDVEMVAGRATIDSLDPDATVRDLVAKRVRFRDLEVAGADLERAFFSLTGDDRPVPRDSQL